MAAMQKTLGTYELLERIFILLPAVSIQTTITATCKTWRQLILNNSKAIRHATVVDTDQFAAGVEENNLPLPISGSP